MNYMAEKLQLVIQLRLMDRILKIVGIHKNIGDYSIYIPYTTACRLAGSAEIQGFAITAKDTNKIDTAVNALKKYIFGIMKDDNLYEVNTMKQYLQIINTLKTILSTSLGGIAGISLLVAGIGIMNIMLVSVVERTKEIGIRKSMGAKKKDIVRQFVIEAASISALGGSIGILFGVVVTNVLGSFIGKIAENSLGNVGTFAASPSLTSILLSFGVSTAIGICFGYMPAKKAANLNPIDALRSE
jgi:putative ABC transport system permease protein